MKCCMFRAIKEVLGFLEAALMGCFFTCFRIKGDEDRRKVRLSTNSIPSKKRDPLVSKNQFDAVLPCEEKGSPCGQVLRPSLQEDFDEDSISSDLEHEAKYLKSCGALLETPPEIRRASGKIIVQTPEENGVHMDFHSLLPAASCKKLQWKEQLNLISDSLTQVDNSDFLEHKSGGCNSDNRQTSTKFVHCEGNKHASAVESNVESVMLDISPSKSDSKAAVLGSNDSPYPTPLNLTDEMQTPGTVFPNNQENLRTRKSSRICRMQYAYPVLKPVENLPHWNTLREDTSLSQSAEHPEQEKKIPCPDYRGRTQQISLAPAPMDSKLFESQRFSSPNDRISQVQGTVSREESVHDKSLSSPTSLFSSGELLNSNVDTPNLVIASLSQWPKPPLPKDDIGNSKNFTKEKTHSVKSYGASKPIMGIDTDELSHISPKWWDGNGIPNTTNKFKEDQKVSWHATPFEERLEKALSDEKLISKRKLPNGGPIELEDDG